MAGKVIWTLRSQADRKHILNYWMEHDKSNTYSKKLNRLFKEAAHLIKTYPNIGKPTDIEHVSVKIIRDYLMFYEISGGNIYILTIWDSRQNPSKLRLR